MNRYRERRRIDILTRLATGLLGVLLICASAFGITHFNPPIGADPGGVNAVYLTLVLMAAIGTSMIAYSLRRHGWYYRY